MKLTSANVVWCSMLGMRWIYSRNFFLISHKRSFLVSRWSLMKLGARSLRYIWSNSTLWWLRSFIWHVVQLILTSQFIKAIICVAYLLIQLSFQANPGRAFHTLVFENVLIQQLILKQVWIWTITYLLINFTGNGSWFYLQKFLQQLFLSDLLGLK